MTPAEIAQLRALAEAATCGPWEAGPEGGSVLSPNMGPMHGRLVAGQTYPKDAAFIAACRTAVPALLDEVERLTVEVVDTLAAGLEVADRESPVWTTEDRPLPEDAAIAAAFPTRSGLHDVYQEAMRLVGAKRSKGALVGLVNWLLVEQARQRRFLEEIEAMTEDDHVAVSSVNRLALAALKVTS